LKAKKSAYVLLISLVISVTASAGGQESTSSGTFTVEEKTFIEKIGELLKDSRIIAGGY
jgi:hypothetical protein